VIEWGGIRAFSGFRAGVSGRRLATLLMTDVVDSTAMAKRLGDVAWRDRLSAHYESARACVQDFNGREVKTTGDGMLVTFDGCVPALRCAAQLGATARRDGFHIRAGVNVGEIEILDGDIRGIAVHEVSRIQAAAGEDEILVSETTRALALSAGLLFDDRGVRDLKGIGEARLYAFEQD
jgi:class 3 adenylate cyclase